MTDTVIDNPTYMEQVRHFFEDVDCQQMFSRGVDLTTYPKLNARRRVSSCSPGHRTRRCRRRRIEHAAKHGTSRW